MIVKIDSREQKPYSFETPSQVGGLTCGDYSLVNGEHLIAIERKSLDDLIGSLTTGRERFEAELRKGQALDHFHLVIEASLSDLVNGRYRSNMSSKSAIQSLIAFSIRYRLPVWFCENRKYAERITESLLSKYAHEIQKKCKIIEGVAGQVDSNERG